jgi:RHS repeat-associated protein
MRLLIKSGTGSYNYSYRYDALGRRVGWTRKNGTNPTGGGPTKTMVFVSAGMQEIAEYEQGTLKRIYVYGSYIDEPLMMMPVGGGPVKKYYYHANNLYNVTAITDKNGVVVERYNYSPYGEATILDAAGTTVLGASTIANPWTFTGRRLDAETGLMYYRARYYDVDLGRFIGRDPLGYVDGLSLYMAYMVPNGLDPFGLVEEIDVQIAEGILLHHQKMLSEALDLIEKYAQKLTACPPNNLTAAQHNTIRHNYQSLNQHLPRLQQNVRDAQLSLQQLKALWAAEAVAASGAVATIGGAPAGALLTASGTYGIAQAAAGWTIVGAVAVGSTATGYGMGSISVPGGDGVSYHDYWGGAMYEFCPWCFGGKQ